MYVSESVSLHVIQSYLAQVHDPVVPAAHMPTSELHVKSSDATDASSTVEDVDEHVLSNKAAKASQSAREFV
jgi:hypothetical protein